MTNDSEQTSGAHVRCSAVVSRKSLVHGIAKCTQCDWECQDYIKVQKAAKHHAKTKHHKVEMELGYAVTTCV
jgi:hypothetical protein